MGLGCVGQGWSQTQRRGEHRALGTPMLWNKEKQCVKAKKRTKLQEWSQEVKDLETQSISE